MADPPNSNDPDSDPESDPVPPGLPEGTGLWLWLTLAVYLGIILVQLFPFDFAAGSGSPLSLAPAPWWTIGLQILLFAPLGVVDGELARRFFRGWGIGATGAVLVALDAAFLGLICETVQHWIASRSSLLADVLAATFGGVLGYMLSSLWRGHPE